MPIWCEIFKKSTNQQDKTKHKHWNKGFTLVMFFRGIPVKVYRGNPVFSHWPPCCIQSGWDTACESPLWIRRCSGNFNRGFAVVKVYRGIPVFSNQPPCCIQSWWDTACESQLWIRWCSGNFNRGFAVVKFDRGVLVRSNPSPCYIQSGWTQYVKVHFEYDGALVM